MITDVRDTTPPSNGHGWGGEHWNVSNYYATLIKVASGLRSRYGGGFISGGPTKYGGGNSYAIWIGNRDHAVGIWRVGDGTFQIEVNASGGTGPAKLLSLAYLVVYKFAPFAQS